MKHYFKQAVTAFVELVFRSILNVCFQVAVFGCNGAGEFLDLILVSLFTGTPVQIVLALIKKGAKVMHNKVKKTSDKGQKPKVSNKTRDKAKVGIAWLS